MAVNVYFWLAQALEKHGEK